MFSSFRHKLLFWFLVIGSSNLLLLWITGKYFDEREQTVATTQLVESAYVFLLKDVKAQQDFFSYETKNETYFQSGKSTILTRHRAWLDSLKGNINQALASSHINSLHVRSQLDTVKNQIQLIDQVFSTLILLVKERGYKDYNLEGKMRDHAHWLEKSNWLEQKYILSLRRHEKDYIIRNEETYVAQLNDLVAAIQKLLRASKWLSPDKKDSVSYHLGAYQRCFNDMVALDRKIGIKDNTGAKHLLDSKVEALALYFDQLVAKAKVEQKKLFIQLNYYYLGMAIGMMILAIAISYWIAIRITKPLVELTAYITRFVNNNFLETGGYPTITSRDELGRLNRHFLILKDEVISRMRYFQKKVDERTKELSEANQKLRRVNEANSRFVPREFLQFLSKDSIEDVMLGDQVEHEMTVMFTDIRSFTKISESLSPQENFDFINGYLKEIVPVIRKHRGFIDKYIGDSVMALFPDSPDAALLAALEFEKAVQDFNVYLVSKDLAPILIGSGIHTGRLILGTIGNDQRLETTVISDSVNIASRMEGLTKHYHCRIVVSEDAVSKLVDPEKFYFRYLDTVRVKGKSRSMAVYTVLNEDESKLRASYQDELDEAVQLMKDRNLGRALEVLTQLVHLHPDDGLLGIFLARCKNYIANGLPEEWDGTHTLNLK